MIQVRLIAASLACSWVLLAQAAAPERSLFSDDSLPEDGTVMQTGGISLEQAVAMVQAKYGARVMRANSVEENGRVVHYIRLMSQDTSRVWTVRIDAASGREF